MSNITIVDPPTTRRVGRKPRLSDEQLKDLADAVLAGKFGSDQEPTSRSGAYQRANAAVKALETRYQIPATTLTTTTYQDEKNPDPNKFYWCVGPLPKDQKSRRGTKRPRKS